MFYNRNTPKSIEYSSKRNIIYITNLISDSSTNSSQRLLFLPCERKVSRQSYPLFPQQILLLIGKHELGVWRASGDLKTQQLYLN